MKLPSPNLPSTGATGLLANVIDSLTKYLRLVQNQVNGMGDGRITAHFSADIAPPAPSSVVEYAQGDFIRNKAPAELGSTGAKYVLFGWMCVAGGKPGTWVQCRFPTGN